MTKNLRKEKEGDMENKKIEHALKVIKEIVARVRPDVIKKYEMPTLFNMLTGKETGFAVILTLSTRYDYASKNLEEWRKHLDADDYIISVNRNRLQVQYNIMNRRERK